MVKVTVLPSALLLAPVPSKIVVALAVTLISGSASLS
jgi:hypothetical protein